MQRRHSNNDVVAATAATYSSGIRWRPRCSTARMFADDSLPSRLSLLPSILVGQSTSAANSRGTNALISQAQRKHLRPSTSSEEISRAAQPISVSSVAKHLWDLSQNMHHQYGTTVSNTTLIKSSRFSGTLHVSPVVITDGHPVWQWDSFQQRRARSRVLMRRTESGAQFTKYLTIFWSRRYTCCSIPWTSSHLLQKVRNRGLLGTDNSDKWAQTSVDGANKKAAGALACARRCSGIAETVSTCLQLLVTWNMNEVNPRRAQLIFGWVTIFGGGGIPSRYVTRSTQPCIPQGRLIEYQLRLG